MAMVHDPKTSKDEYDAKEHACRQTSYQAYEILHFGFALLPIIAGLDKFFNFLTIWSAYLAPQFNVLGDSIKTMHLVGVIEIIAGLGVWFKPKIFAYVVALWMLGTIINLLLLHNFYDVALRDFGLLLGALALARLSVRYDHCCHHEHDHKNPKLPG